MFRQVFIYRLLFTLSVLFLMLGIAVMATHDGVGERVGMLIGLIGLILLITAVLLRDVYWEDRQERWADQFYQSLVDVGLPVGCSLDCETGPWLWSPLRMELIVDDNPVDELTAIVRLDPQTRVPRIQWNGEWWSFSSLAEQWVVKAQGVTRSKSNGRRSVSCIS